MGAAQVGSSSLTEMYSRPSVEAFFQAAPNSTWLLVEGLEARHILALRDKFAASPASVNNLLRALSSMMSWSAPRGWRSDNPCTHVRKFKSGEGYRPWIGKRSSILESQRGQTYGWQRLWRFIPGKDKAM